MCEEVWESVWGEFRGCEKCVRLWSEVRKDAGKGVGGVKKCGGCMG